MSSAFPSRGRIRGQFVRWAIIGVVLNASLYVAYLLLTSWGMGSRPAMTLTYVTGVLLGFALNRSITFRFRGGQIGALARYLASYAIGYAIDFGGLWLLVDQAGFRHQWVQAFLTVAIALILFALQRAWVFSPSPLARRNVAQSA